MKKRLLYIHQYFKFPDTNMSSIRSYEIAFALSSCYEVVIITNSLISRNYRLFSNYHIPNTSSSLSIISFPFLPKNTYSFPVRIVLFVCFALFSSVFALFVRCDLVFASSTPFTVFIPAIIRRLLCRTPYIAEVRDVWPDIPIAMNLIRCNLFANILRRYASYTYDLASGIIVLSSGMRSSLLESYSVRTPICVASNFFDSREFETSFLLKPTLIDQLHSQSKKILLYTGTLGLVNDPLYIAKLAYYSIDIPIHFIIIGDGNMKNSFLSYSSSLGVLDNNLTYFPPLPRSEILNYLQFSDFSISTIQPITELENNSANKFFESLASSSCTLINHCGWMQTVLDTTQSGLSLGYDPYNASRILKRLINTPQRISHYASNGKYLAYDKYERSVITSKIIKFIQSTLND